MKFKNPEQIARRYIERKYSENSPKIPNETETKVDSETPTNLTSTQDSWKIEGVEYRDGIYTVNLAKQLLDNGKAKTQNQWTDYRNQSNSFYTADMPLHHSIFKALYQQRDTTEAKEAREFLEQQFREKWLQTLTRITYTPKGKDKLTHNIGTQEQYEINENIVGENGQIINIKTPKFLEALLGSSNKEEINNIYKWITNKDAYIWRINKNPKQNLERVAGFDSDSDWANLDCDRYLGISYASLGVNLDAFGVECG